MLEDACLPGPRTAGNSQGLDHPHVPDAWRQRCRPLSRHGRAASATCVTVAMSSHDRPNAKRSPRDSAALVRHARPRHRGPHSGHPRFCLSTLHAPSGALTLTDPAGVTAIRCSASARPTYAGPVTRCADDAAVISVTIRGPTRNHPASKSAPIESHSRRMAAAVTANEPLLPGSGQPPTGALPVPAARLRVAATIGSRSAQPHAAPSRGRSPGWLRP